jgi:mediator of RNA polymerase II transcription subunit 18
MHELLLFGQVPRARHEQLLKIFAGVAAMQPQRVLERHVVYKPQRDPEEPGSNIRRGASQGVVQKQAKQAAARDLYFTQMVQTLTEESFTGQDSEARWTFQFNDVPDTGDRGVTVRMASSTDLAEGDPHAYMVGFGNK